MEHMGLKITQISPGLISIPPNGWGAIEKIIWNYKLNLEKLGHEVDIKYINQVTKEDGLIHVHVANQALELRDKGIPYIFSLHDHHVVHYGVGSYNHNINLEAIKHSVISITYAEFLVNHFEETDKLFYLSHGVDTEYFKPDNQEKIEHKLLCLANNGMAGDSSIDRKGFLLAIDAAKQLNLPITIAGPTDNLEFFKYYPEYLKYEKLILRCDSPTEDEILELYRSHTLFLHPSMLEAGHPNLTMLEALACGLPVIGTYDGTKDIGGLIKVQRDVDSLVNGIINASNRYDELLQEIEITRKEYSWKNITNRLNKIYQSVLIINKEFSNEIAKHAYIDAYNDTKIEYKKPIDNLEVNIHFVDGPFLELKGNTNKKYKVQFIDEQGKIHYEDSIGCNMWVRLSRKYFTKWIAKVFDEDTLVYTYTLNLENQRVLLGLESKSLGDTLAWMPYIDEFRKKHKCKVIASTFHNYFFKNAYPELEFIEPGEVAHNLMAKYDIGWFYDVNKEPVLPNVIPLQKTATNILGLEYQEIIPNLDFKPKERPYKEKYITIATASTSGLKYWTREGWSDVVKFLKEKGYQVIHISKEHTDLDVEQLQDTSMENTMNVLYHSEFFIGLSSGLSWLAWALRKKTVMISNFTTADHEFQTDCLRITDTSVCHGCWNEPNFTFDKGDWNWCPKHQNTDRHFECHKKITSDIVINKIKTLL
jgi:autotransporter strand-loop-strand O-heptosyltransferase